MCKKKAEKHKSRKCNIKCATCEYYSKDTDFCKAREIENCSMQVNTDFAQCSSYLVDSKLVMF
jgi:hypothetical protein